MVEGASAEGDPVRLFWYQMGTRVRLFWYQISVERLGSKFRYFPFTVPVVKFDISATHTVRKSDSTMVRRTAGLTGEAEQWNILPKGR